VKKIVRKCIAEFFGTMMLTLIACGVAARTGNFLATAFAFGLVLTAMIYTIGDISGCHINPAVSFGMWIAGKMKLDDMWKYMIAQVAGAIVGSLLLALCLTSFKSLGANMVVSDTNIFIGFLIEIILTFIFVTVILKVTEKKENNHAGIIIGLTLMLVHLFGIGFTGTSVNPARSIGPALFELGDTFIQLWVFILGPMAGAALAGLFYKFVLKD
jgi:aquaporin Z